MKIKTMDFFDGVDNADEVLAEILDNGIYADLRKATVLKIADNAEKVFRKCSKSDITEYQAKGTREKEIIHYMAFINTEAYLKISE